MQGHWRVAAMSALAAAAVLAGGLIAGGGEVAVAHDTLSVPAAPLSAKGALKQFDATAGEVSCQTKGTGKSLGELEIWRVVSDLHHPVHVHLDPFQVVSRRGGAPAPTDAGWKDTVDVRPNEFVDLAVRFRDYAGRYLMHCHNLEHEDMAMMATFRTA